MKSTSVGHPRSPEDGGGRWPHASSTSDRSQRRRSARGPVPVHGGLLMRRVVVTGMGIVSCLGNAADKSRAPCATVSAACAPCRTTPRAACAARWLGACRRSTDVAEIDRKLKRFMGDAAGYACRHARGHRRRRPRARAHPSPRIGVIAGSGGGSAQWQIETGDLLREKGRAPRRTLHGAAHHVLDGVGGAGHGLRHPRPQLLHRRRPCHPRHTASARRRI